MNGIHYVIDEQGRKIAVQIDLRQHGELWEELSDILVAEERRNEPSIPYSEFFLARGENR